ncbi:hypothetical protein PanWU01x14_180440, partial [Parasponia andersonii]
FAVTPDFQQNFDSSQVYRRFYDKSYASASILLYRYLICVLLQCTPQERLRIP